MLEIVIPLATAAVLVLAGLWLLQRRLTYFPVAEVPPLSASLPGAQIYKSTPATGSP